MEEKLASSSPSILKSEQQKAKIFLLKMIGLFTSTQYVELCKYLAEEQNVFFANVNSVLLSSDTNITSNKKDLLDLIEDKVLSSNYMRIAIEPVVMVFKAGLQELLAGFYLRNINESTSIIDAINISAKVNKYACQAQKICLKLNDKNSSLRLDNFLIQVEDQLFKKLLAQTPEEDLFNKTLATFDFKAVDLDVDVEIINKIATVENLLRLKYLEVSKDDLNGKLILAYIDSKLSKITSVFYPKFYQEFSRLIALVSDDKVKQVLRAWQTELKQITDESRPVGELKKLFTTISDFASSRGTLNLQSLIELLKRFMPCYQMHVSLTQSILHKAYEEALYKPNTSILLKLEYQLPFNQATISKCLDIIRNQVPAFMRDNLLPLNGSHLSSEEWSTAVFQAQAEYTRSFCSLLNRIAYGVELLLGLDSTQEITLLLLGSAANNSLTPYSDVEYALITQKSYAAVQCFTSLFNYQINKLGEWSEDKNGNILHEGFCVDPGANPAVDPRLVASAAVLPSQFNRDEDARWRLHDGMAYSLFNPLSVYSFSAETENTLIQQYQDANKYNQESVIPLAELPKLVNGQCIYRGIDRDLPLHKACALAYLERDLHGFCEENASDAVGTIFPDFTGVNGKYKSLGESFCAKKRLVKPLSYILLDLALYTGVPTGTIEGAIEGLCSAQNNIPAKLASHLKEELRLAIAQLTTIRYRQQYFYKKQCEPETLVIPAAVSKSEYKECYILNDEEWEIIQSVETRLIWPFYQVLVTGLLKRNSVTQLNQLKNLDPAINLMEELLAQVKDYYRLEKKPEVDEQLAKNTIASYILTLIVRKAPYVQHQQTYEELPAFLQQHYCYYLQQYDKSAEAAKLVSPWQAKLAWFPEPNGERPIVQQQQQQWQRTCDKLITSLDQWKKLIDLHYAGKKVPLLCVRRIVRGEVIDSAFHPEVILYLLNKNVINTEGLLQPRNQHASSIKEIKGRHLVVPIDVPIDGTRIRVHLKFFPELPGMEYAAASLSRLLAGYGSPFTELVRLELKKFNIPLLVMETILGDDLDAAAKLSPDLANLQPEFFSKTVLQAITLNREDGKGDNTYLTPCPLNSTQVSLILIDSERCFFPAIGRDEKGRLIPYVKEIIFCLPQMLNKIQASTAKEFLALDLYALLKHWLVDYLQAESIKIAQLFNVEEMKALFPKEAQTTGVINFIKKLINTEKEFISSSILPLTLLESDIAPLYKKLYKLQSALRKELGLSHFELLSIAEPMLARYYQRLLELDKVSIRDRFAKGFVTTGLYQQTSAGHQLSHMLTQQILQTAKNRQIQITDLLANPNRFKEEITRKLEQATKQAAALSLFKASSGYSASIDKIFELLNGDQDAAILDEINFKDIQDTQFFLNKLLTNPTDFRYLRLLNCNNLTGNLLNQIRKQFPSLQILNISGCTQLQVNDLRNLALSPGLTKLIANRHTQLQQLRLEAPLFSGGIFAEAYFARLQHLELSECSNLHTLVCKTPDLKSIKLKENKQLKKLQIEAKSLEMIDLRGSSLENDDGFLLDFFNPHMQLTELWVTNNEVTNRVLKHVLKTMNIGLPLALQKINVRSALALLANPDFHTEELMSWCFEKNEWEIIMYLVKKNPILVNYFDVTSGESLLIHALKADAREAAEELLHLGADAKITDKRGRTALHWACLISHLDIVELLLKQDVDKTLLNKARKDKKTPLMEAALGRDEVVRYLLAQEGIMVEAQDETGYTAFHWACWNDDLACAELIYQKNPELLYQEDNYGQTGFYIACWQGHLNIVKWLLEVDLNKPFLNQTLKNKKTPLMAAVSSGKVEVARFLLEQADLDWKAQDEDGWTAFHWACHGGDLACAELIYQKNPEILYQKDNDDQTGFYLACRQGHLDIVKWLLEVDINKKLLNQTLKNKKTPLLEAASSGKVEVVRFLLEQIDIIPEAQDEDGWTVFHWVCAIGDLACAELIYHKNPELLYQEDNNDQTVFLIACLQGHLAIVKWILKLDAIFLNKAEKNKITPLIAAAASGKAEVMEFLLEQVGIAVEDQAKEHTVFGVACGAGDLACAERIYQKRPELLYQETRDGEIGFHLACKQGHLAIVEWVLKIDLSLLNKAKKNKKTPLMLAASEGKIEVVGFLLDHAGIDVEAEDEKGRTAFHMACLGGDLDCAKLLYQKCPTFLYQETNNGQTGFYLACMEGHLDIIKWLLEVDTSKVLLNKAKKNKETPLMKAVEREKIEVVEFLLEQVGIAVEAYDEDGLTAFHWACGGSDLDCVKLLYKKHPAFLYQEDNKGRTGFYLACWIDLDIVKWLLKKDASKILLNKADNNKKTPLMNAVSERELEMVQFLLEQADIDWSTQDKDGYTAFHWACHEGYLSSAELLYQKHPTLLYQEDKEGQSVLYIACWQGDLDVVKWLLEVDINKSLLNKANKNKKTPLMEAASEGDLEIVEFLLEQTDIDLRAQDEDGYTAFHWACHSGDLFCAEELYQRHPAFLYQEDNYGQTVFDIAGLHGHLDIMEWLLEEDTSKKLLNKTDKNKTTLLMKAVHRGNVEIVRWLLDLKADVMIKDEQGDTAFSLAYERGYLDIAEMIAKRNEAVLNLPYGDPKHTVLMRASCAGKQEVVDWLLDLKADVLIQNDNGETVFSMVCGRGNLVLAKRLYARDARILNHGRMTGLIAAAEAGKQEIVNWLLDLKADVLIQNDKGETVFSMACGRGDLVLAKRLYACDARILNHGYKTGLMTAAAVGKQEIVNWLLDLKADVLVQNDKKETVFSIACGRGDLVLAKRLYACDARMLNYGHMTGLIGAAEAGKQEVVDWLLDLKADVLVQNEKGETVFSIACGRGDLVLAKRLYACDARILNHGYMTGLMTAAAAGKQEIVEWLLSLEADVMIQDRREETAFSVACEKGYLKIAEMIVKRNEAVLNLQKWDKRTLLMEAIESGKEEIIEFLLRLKANVMIENLIKETAFNLACRKGDLTLAQRLYTYDARVLNHGCRTGLMAAVAAGKEEVVKWLLDLQADVMIEDHIYGSTAFSLACGKGNLTLAQRLYNYDAKVLNHGRTTGLMAAVIAGKEEAVEWLLDLKADVMLEQNSFNETAFSLAYEKGYLRIAEMIAKENEAVLNLQYCQQSWGDRGTPLMHAVKSGKEDLIEFLLNLKADVVIQNDRGGTAFGLACDKGYLKIAEKIVKKNEAVLNLQYGQDSEEMGTPLMHAIKSGKEDLIDFLLNLKPDVVIQNNKRETAFSLACEKDNFKIAEILIRRNETLLNLQYFFQYRWGQNQGTPLMHAIKLGKEDLVEVLLNLKADVIIQNYKGKTAFSLACKKGDLKLAKQLYAYDTRVLGYGHITGLMAAAAAGKQEIVAWLLELDISQAENIFGDTACFLACREGHITIVELFYNKDPKLINHINYFGISSLMAACLSGRAEVVKFLLDKKVSLEDSDMWNMTAFDYALLGQNREILDIFLKFNSTNVKGHPSIIYLINLFGNKVLIDELNLQIKETQDVKNQTLLFILSYFSLLFNHSGEKISFIDELLSSGAEINCQDGQGNTPLLLAIRFCKKDSVGIIKHLLTKKASVDHKNHKGEGVLELAQENGDPRLIEFIQEQCTNFSKQVSQTTLFGHSYASATAVSAAAASAALIMEEDQVMLEDKQSDMIAKPN